MGKKTKKIFIIALLVSIFLGTTLAIFLKIILAKGVLLEEQVAILNENNTKESAYILLQRTVQETEEQRATLASSFFKSESDSVAFLGDIENTANSLGLVFKTESLDKVVDKEKNREFVRMSFIYEGKKDTVLAFSKLMELIPRHSIVESLALRKVADDNWEGRLSILITLNSI